MTKNLQIALIILAVLIGIFFLNKNSQLKLETVSEAIFTNDPEDIFKFLIQKGEEAIELARIDTMWHISGNDTLKVKSISIDNLFSGALSEATSANFHANWFCFFNLNLAGYAFTINFFNFFLC